MNSKTLLNVVLLIAIAVLGTVAFFEPGKEEPKITHLADVEEDALDKVVLQGKELIVLEKREGQWWLTSPFSAPANGIRVHQLIDIAKAESEGHYPLKSEDLAKFELDKPKASLTLGSAKLIFGGSDPLDMRRYVRVGDQLHLVNDDFFHHLIASPTDYVDKKLLPEEAKLNELFLPGLKATLGQDGHWALEPASDAAAGMDELVTAWQSARAIEVKRLDAAPQGDVVRIGLAGQPAIEFVIVQREPDLLLARADLGLQYMLAAESAKRLLSLAKPGDAPKPEEEDKATEDDDTGDGPEDGLPGGEEIDGDDVEEQE